MRLYYKRNAELTLLFSPGLSVSSFPDSTCHTAPVSGCVSISQILLLPVWKSPIRLAAALVPHTVDTPMVMSQQ